MWTKTLQLTSIWKIGLGQIENGFWEGTNDNGNDDDDDEHRLCYRKEVSHPQTFWAGIVMASITPHIIPHKTMSDS